MGRLSFIFLILFSAVSQAQPYLKEGLESFLKKNTVYPPFSLQNCIQGTVSVGFKLNALGEVYQSSIRSGIGVDLDDEALRLIRMTTGKWVVPENYDTAQVVVVPVSFKLSGYGCETKTSSEITQAINRYQADRGLTDAILNFYKNKFEGKAVDADESRFIALKNELGYDEEFFQEKIEQGRAKLKQNDRQGACEDFMFVKYMGSSLADDLIGKYCKP